MADPAVDASQATASATTSAAAPTQTRPLLSYGSRGEAVKTVQRTVGTSADGIFGPATLAAVKVFQAKKGLVADGIVGKLTWAQVDGSSDGTTTTPPATAPVATPVTTAAGAYCSATSSRLRLGSTGQLVKVLQGHLGLVTDGWFGPVTRTAVMDFQRTHGLDVDGIVGAATWTKLGCQTAVATPAAPVTTTPAPTTPVATTPIATPPVSTTGTGAATTATGADILAYAKTFVGVPYVWGGSTPAGFDCSGFTSYVYKHFGIALPRTAAQQQNFATPTSNPQPGDLVFFGAPAYHVAIYVGNGMMIDSAHPGSFISVRSFYGAPTGFGSVAK